MLWSWRTGSGWHEVFIGRSSVTVSVCRSSRIYVLDMQGIKVACIISACLVRRSKWWHGVPAWLLLILLQEWDAWEDASYRADLKLAIGNASYTLFAESIAHIGAWKFKRRMNATKFFVFRWKRYGDLIMHMVIPFSWLLTQVHPGVLTCRQRTKAQVHSQGWQDEAQLQEVHLYIYISLFAHGDTFS
jgi:hypothetical protein